MSTLTITPLPPPVEDAARIALPPPRVGTPLCRRAARAVCAATLRWAADQWDSEREDEQWIPADPMSAWLRGLAAEVSGQGRHRHRHGAAS